jgi:hypothetical protein
MGTRGPFPRGKVWPGCDADHSPPSSAEVKNEYELYLLSPQAPPWHVAGSLYLLPMIKMQKMIQSFFIMDIHTKILELSALYTFSFPSLIASYSK